MSLFEDYIGPKGKFDSIGELVDISDDVDPKQELMKFYNQQIERFFREFVLEDFEST